MSDFETVLERLLADPAFQAALAEDPERALAGYTLDADERAVLNSQLVLGGQASGAVESRTTKSGVVGLIGPVAAAFGAAAVSSGTGGEVFGGARPTGREAFGPAGGRESFGATGGGEGFGGTGGEGFGAARQGGGEAWGAARQGGREAFGTSRGAEAFGASPGTEAFGPGGEASGPGAEAFGASRGGGESFGAATPPGEVWGERAAEGFGRANDGEQAGAAPVEATDYHTRVDVDGDGTWDAHRAYERPDGGVDIHVDADGDGRVDFVGHDRDRDGLVDSAEFDNDRDGVFETRMYDDTGDGWLDRSERIRRGDAS
jgi:hypothetical protein